MKLRTFKARTIKDALAEVKKELGPDAMIVATRQHATMVEVTAATDEDEPKLTDAVAPAAAQPQITDRDLEQIVGPLRSELRALRSQVANKQDHTNEELRRELYAMREALQKSRHPADLRNLAHRDALVELARTNVLAKPSEGKRIALVGPTGVGKTTTIAKLAAHAALIERRRVAIVTVDTYRVGGEAQIRTFGKLIGVPVIVVADLAELGARMRMLTQYDVVYIDTAGRSPRDKEAIRELIYSLGNVPGLELHLTIAAGSPRSVVDGWMQRIGADNVDRILYTKIDEADSFRELVEAPARHNKPVAFITTGQRVPEDIENATAERLIELATCGLSEKEVAA